MLIVRIALAELQERIGECNFGHPRETALRKA